jgi:hypothetical protein
MADVDSGSIQDPVVILWIFPWMIGACLGLAGYLRYRHDAKVLADACHLVPARVETPSARPAITGPGRRSS